MRYAQSDSAPENIESLRQKLPPFNARAVADLTSNSALQDYLEFLSPADPKRQLTDYLLGIFPRMTNRLILWPGTLSMRGELWFGSRLSRPYRPV